MAARGGNNVVRSGGIEAGRSGRVLDMPRSAGMLGVVEMMATSDIMTARNGDLAARSAETVAKVGMVLSE
jgi:hypothetical protein